MMKKVKAIMVGFVSGMVVGLTSTKMQCKMRKFWEDMTMKDCQMVPECCCCEHQNQIDLEFLQKDLQIQLSKLKRMYKELMKSDLTEEIRGKIRNLFRGIESLMDKLKSNTSDEELES